MTRAALLKALGDHGCLIHAPTFIALCAQGLGPPTVQHRGRKLYDWLQVITWLVDRETRRIQRRA